MTNPTKPLTEHDNPHAAAPAQPEARTGSRRHWKTIDWGKAAGLIASGATVEAVAATLGCQPDRILRNLRRSARFRHRIDRAVERLNLSARLRFAALSDDATREMRRRTSQGQDHRLLQWLGEKLKLDRELQSTLSEQWVAAAATPKRRKAPERPAETGTNGTEQARTGSNGLKRASNGTERASQQAETGRNRPDSVRGAHAL
jgi:hypothetical protein